MKIVSYGDNLHDILKAIYGKIKENINLSSAEFAKRMVTANYSLPN